MSAGTIASRLAAVRAGITEACAAAGRDPSEVELVAVSKLHPATAVAEAKAADQLAFGENYAQELRDKAREVRGVRWHFIGPLQRNKVKYVVGVATLVHTVDNLSLLDEIARRADTAGLVQPCLVEVNLGGEAQKAGCSPEDLPALVEEFRARPSVRLDGLMCIPPGGEPARAHFARLRALRDEERARSGLALPHLSMGMTADYADAIAEGATLVRVGTAIFGERPK